MPVNESTKSVNDQKYKHLEGEVGELKTEIGGIKEDVGELKADIGIMGQNYVSLKHEVSAGFSSIAASVQSLHADSKEERAEYKAALDKPPKIGQTALVGIVSMVALGVGAFWAAVNLVVDPLEEGQNKAAASLLVTTQKLSDDAKSAREALRSEVSKDGTLMGELNKVRHEQQQERLDYMLGRLVAFRDHHVEQARKEGEQAVYNKWHTERLNDIDAAIIAAKKEDATLGGYSVELLTRVELLDAKISQLRKFSPTASE